MNTASFLAIPAGIAPAQEALVFADERFTYAALLGRVRRCAGALAGLGVGRGTPVAALHTNSHRYIETYFATAMLGGVFVPLNYRAKLPELEYMLATAGARVLLVGERYAEHAAALRLRVPGLDQPGTPGDPVGEISSRSGKIARRAVDRWHAPAHRTDVDAQLTAMVNQVEQIPPGHLAKRRFPNQLALSQQPARPSIPATVIRLRKLLRDSLRRSVVCRNYPFERSRRRVQLPVSFPRTEKLRQQRRHIGDRPSQLASRTRPLVRPKVQLIFGQCLQHPSKSGRFILPETQEKFAIVHCSPPYFIEPKMYERASAQVPRSQKTLPLLLVISVVPADSHEPHRVDETRNAPQEAPLPAMDSPLYYALFVKLNRTAPTQ